MSRYEFIDSQKAEPDNRNPVLKMCRWLEVGRRNTTCFEQLLMFVECFCRGAPAEAFAWSGVQCVSDRGQVVLTPT